MLCSSLYTGDKRKLIPVFVKYREKIPKFVSVNYASTGKWHDRFQKIPPIGFWIGEAEPS